MKLRRKRRTPGKPSFPFMKTELERLFAHLEWADAEVLNSFRTTPPPPKALETYAHIVGAEHVWMTRIQQKPQEYAVWPTLTVDQCLVVARETAAAFSRLAQA